MLQPCAFSDNVWKKQESFSGIVLPNKELQTLSKIIKRCLRTNTNDFPLSTYLLFKVKAKMPCATWLKPSTMKLPLQFWIDIYTERFLTLLPFTLAPQLPQRLLHLDSTRQTTETAPATFGPPAHSYKRQFSAALAPSLVGRRGLMDRWIDRWIGG